jgi:hypothetical protein
LKIPFNIILPSMSLSLSYGLFSSGFLTKICHVPHVCYMSIHLIFLHLIILIFAEGVKIMKFLMHFSPSSCYFIHVRSRYSPEHSVLRHPESLFFPLWVRDQVPQPYKNRICFMVM